MYNLKALKKYDFQAENLTKVITGNQMKDVPVLPDTGSKGKKKQTPHNVQIIGKKRSKFEMDKSTNENLDWASACADKSENASSTNDFSPLKSNGFPN